jgi:hypothetical protein
MKSKSVSSSEIVECIRSSHTNDVFVEECKDGPTWSGGGHARMDVWTMNRSWSRPRICGYEIKVSRSDFKNDNKWQNYLPMCNQLFFACPKDLIKPEELPGDVGLVYCSIGRMRVIKKATHRDIEIPDSLARYLLMCRTRIVPHSYYQDEKTRSQKLDDWREWLVQKREASNIGYQVARHTSDVFSRLIAENHRLQKENEKLQVAKNWLDEQGIHLHSWNLEDRLKESQHLFPPDFRNDLDNAQKLLKDVLVKMEEYTTPKNAVR